MMQCVLHKSAYLMVTSLRVWVWKTYSPWGKRQEQQWEWDLWNERQMARERETPMWKSRYVSKIWKKSWKSTISSVKCHAATVCLLYGCICKHHRDQSVVMSVRWVAPHLQTRLPWWWQQRSRSMALWSWSLRSKTNPNPKYWIPCRHSWLVYTILSLNDVSRWKYARGVDVWKKSNKLSV